VLTPRTRRRARLASWRAASGVRPVMRNLLEGNIEEIVQDKGDSFRGIESV
jgi:hypothetical protein